MLRGTLLTVRITHEGRRFESDAKVAYAIKGVGMSLHFAENTVSRELALKSACAKKGGACHGLRAFERRRPGLTSPIEVRPLLLRSSSRRSCGSADAFVRRTQARLRGNSQVVRPPPNSL